MKKLILITFIFCSLQVLGQQEKQVYNYCKVKVYTIYKKKDIEVDYGNENGNLNSIRAVAIDTLLDKVNSFKNDILMLNYMSDIGWECCNIVSLFHQYQGADNIIYYFRKLKRKE